MTAEQGKDVYDQTVDVLNDLLLPLRMGEALDEARFLSTLRFLERLGQSLSSSAQVEKRLARLLMDVYPMMLGIAASRAATEAKTLERWAEDLLEAIDRSLD